MSCSLSLVHSEATWQWLRRAMWLSLTLKYEQKHAFHLQTKPTLCFLFHWTANMQSLCWDVEVMMEAPWIPESPDNGDTLPMSIKFYVQKNIFFVTLSHSQSDFSHYISYTLSENYTDTISVLLFKYFNYKRNKVYVLVAKNF